MNTEQAQLSRDKKIAKDISRDFFNLYIEENGLLKASLDNIQDTIRKTKNERLRYNASVFLIEQIIGKAQSNTDITSQNSKIQTVLLDIFKDNE